MYLSTSTRSSSVKYLLQILSTAKPCPTSENDFIHVKMYNKMYNKMLSHYSAL